MMALVVGVPPVAMLVLIPASLRYRVRVTPRHQFEVLAAEARRKGGGQVR
ncbi:MAG TPA: hypothetical protein VEV61_10310 [Streptosporangiaceae bacterium]|nr:hypothetical protein [Streptosporangiaceae bacterium]